LATKEEAMSATHDDKRRDSGFTQLAAAVAVLLSMASLLAVAFKLDDNNSSTQATTAGTSMGMNSGAMNSGMMNGSSSSVAASSSESVKLVIKSDEEKGKKGPDGSWHDAFLPADFSVKAGATVRVTVYNYDDMPHSFTAAELGTNQTIPGGSEEKPSETTFTFQAPQKAGSYDWYCALPCDPWAMTHNGFMKGRVTVT
jgi:plastocyanin